MRDPQKVRRSIESLADRVESGRVGRSRPWGGADVGIVEVAPPPRETQFYPDPRYVETPHVAELSWLFEELLQIFRELDGFGFWKEEFFGRLGNVAEKFHSVCPEGSQKGLLLAVLEEAFSMASEIEASGGLPILMVTSGNRILDDFTKASDRNSYLSRDLVERRIDLYVGDWAIELDSPGSSSQDGSGVE